jgi:hypothetical protein
MTKNEFIATRLAKMRLAAAEARLVIFRKTSADPGGFTTGKIAAIARNNVLNIPLLAHDDKRGCPVRMVL